MRSLRRGIAAAVVMAGLVNPSPAQAPAAGVKKPAVEIVFVTSPLVECHFYLKTWTGPSEKPISGQDGDLGSEASAYARAAQSLRDPAAWRWFEDFVVAGPDPAAVREGTKTLPQAFDSPSSRTAVDMLVEALASAYPKFIKAYWPNHDRSLNRVLVSARRPFDRASDRIEQTLMEKMAFVPVGAPIRVIAVVHAGPYSSWGKAGESYYTVIETFQQSPGTFAETTIHEATHIIDARQPGAGLWMLKEVRQALGKDAPAESVDAFIHGLIAFNAGELITRYMDKTYKPVGLLGPALKETFAPFVPVYTGAWSAWLDGTRTREETVAKLAEGFKAALKEKAAQPPKKS